MQRKGTNVQDNMTDMHFSVAPYQVVYSTPNDDIYCLYFQKGLQILGSTQYPIQNHQKLNKLSLPIQSNLIQFRLSAKNNFQYKWSLYKRVDEMEEFLQSKKINLKVILQKQPQKSRLATQADQRSQILKRKDSKIQSKSQIRSQIKIQFKSQPRGSVYNQSIVFQTAHFTLNYYLVKGNTYQQLSKAIQDKIKENKIPLSETQGNIAQSSSGVKHKDSIKESAKESKISKKSDKQNISQINQENQQIEPSKVPSDQKAVQLNQKLSQKEANYQQQSETQQHPQQIEHFQKKNLNQQTPIQAVSQYPTIQEGQIKGTTEQAQNLNTNLQKQQIDQTPLKRVEPFASQTNNVAEQGITHENIQQKVETKEQNTTQQNNSQKQTTAAVQIPTLTVGQPSQKRKIFVVLIVIVLIYLVSFFDLLGTKQDVNLSKNQKEKKSKFGNRKKILQ